MSMFCYPAGKPDLKTALIHICQCSNNTFQIRARKDDTEASLLLPHKPQLGQRLLLFLMSRWVDRWKLEAYQSLLPTQGAGITELSLNWVSRLRIRQEKSKLLRLGLPHLSKGGFLV
ncbi:E3 Ubiquitin-Protein Ligase Rnf25 [Manis pentadactyla]|nr:E3 Ubiquitin-Protein Ligase Rnf25 [Manis pentadactyla]